MQHNVPSHQPREEIDEYKLFEQAQQQHHSGRRDTHEYDWLRHRQNDIGGDSLASDTKRHSAQNSPFFQGKPLLENLKEEEEDENDYGLAHHALDQMWQMTEFQDIEALKHHGHVHAAEVRQVSNSGKQASSGNGAPILGHHIPEYPLHPTHTSQFNQPGHYRQVQPFPNPAPQAPPLDPN